MEGQKYNLDEQHENQMAHVVVVDVGLILSRVPQFLLLVKTLQRRLTCRRIILSEDV